MVIMLQVNIVPYLSIYLFVSLSLLPFLLYLSVAVSVSPRAASHLSCCVDDCDTVVDKNSSEKKRKNKNGSSWGKLEWTVGYELVD